MKFALLLLAAAPAVFGFGGHSTGNDSLGRLSYFGTGQVTDANTFISAMQELNAARRDFDGVTRWGTFWNDKGAFWSLAGFASGEAEAAHTQDFMSRQALAGAMISSSDWSGMNVGTHGEWPATALEGIAGYEQAFGFKTEFFDRLPSSYITGVDAGADSFMWMGHGNIINYDDYVSSVAFMAEKERVAVPGLIGLDVYVSKDKKTFHQAVVFQNADASTDHDQFFQSMFVDYPDVVNTMMSSFAFSGADGLGPVPQSVKDSWVNYEASFQFSHTYYNYGNFVR